MKARSAVLVALILVSGCSLDVLPVSQSRLKSARKSKMAIARGPNSPGAFDQVWAFTGPGGYLVDPTRIEIAGGVARVKLSALGQPQVIQTAVGRPFVVLDSFSEVVGPGQHGSSRYQLSNDGARWYWFDGAKWTLAAATYAQANSASEVNARIATFNVDAGQGSLYLKMFLSAPSERLPVELKQVAVKGIAPETDSWN